MDCNLVKKSQLSDTVTFYAVMGNNALYGTYRTYIFGNFNNANVSLSSCSYYNSSGNDYNITSSTTIAKVNDNCYQVATTDSGARGCYIAVGLSITP